MPVVSELPQQQTVPHKMGAWSSQRNSQNPLSATHAIASSKQKVAAFAKRLLHNELEEGDYSIPRLEAFQNYQRSTSSLWLAFLLCITPFPMVLLATAVVSIPLQAPDQGWSRNYSFFAQLWIGCALASVGGQLQRPFYIAKLGRTSRLQNMLLSIGIGGLLMSVVMVLCALVWFPMPFSFYSGNVCALPVFMVLLTLLAKRNLRKPRVVALVHGKQWQSAPSSSTLESRNVNQELFNKYKKLVAINFGLLVIYPFYLVGFGRLNGVRQVVYILLMPTLKRVFATLARKQLAHLGDLLATSTVFTVELFNAMISSLCMGVSQGSLAVSAAIMAVDLAQIVLSTLHVVQQSRRIVAILHSQLLIHDETTIDHVTLPRVIASTLAFANAHRDKLKNVKGIRLQASNSLPFDCPKVLRPLRQLLNSSQKNNTVSQRETNQVITVLPRDGQTTTNTEMQPPAWATSNQLESLQETLALMFRLEFVALVEYIECTIPIMIAVYYAIMYHGPNRPYHLDVAVMTQEQLHASLARILLYGLMECASMVVLFAIVKWRLKMNVLHVVGFALETQWWDIQGKLAFFLPNLLAMRLVHFGVDFTFRFDWMQHQQQNQTVAGEAH